jgi:hypothetical protein
MPDGVGGHEALMVLMPVLVALLCAVIVAVTWLGQRGVIGPLDRVVDRAGALRPVAAGLSAGAGLIHLAATPEHMAESWLFGAFFISAAAFQLGWAGAYLRQESPRIERLGVAVNALVILIWVWSRFVGLPVGPGVWAIEPIGIADLLATGFEASLVWLLRSPLAARSARPRSESLRFADVAIARTFGILAIAILTGAAILEHAGSG